jgi:hypothetical protein
MLGPIKILFLSAVLTAAPQLQHAGKNYAAQSLPDDLSESEGQRILKEQRPKSRVEMAFNVSDARLDSALERARASEYSSAAQNLEVYADLISYADHITHQLTGDQAKERNACLKVIEQRIFKKTQTLDAVARELPFNYRESCDRVREKAKSVRLRALNDLVGGGKMFEPTGDDGN